MRSDADLMGVSCEKNWRRDKTNIISLNNEGSG